MAVNRTAAAGVLAAAVLAAAPSAWAQKPIPEAVRMMEPHRLRIGDVVRVWATAEGPAVEGSVLAVSTSTLTIAGREEAVLVDLPTTSRLQVRHVHQHVRRGAVIGAALGLIAGSFLITREVVGHDVDAWERAAWMTGLTVAGAGAGAGIARLARSETWQPVDLVTLKPQPRTTDMGPGFRVSWTVRF
jgi:hypothetical protein